MADPPSRTEADDAAVESDGGNQPEGPEQRDDTDRPAGTDRTDGDERSQDALQREVLVPMALYKRVTVFSTLAAILLVVGGMIALDAATGRSRADPSEVNLPVALLGLAAIVLGAAVYAFSTRFRAEGMGNAKDGDDEG